MSTALSRKGFLTRMLGFAAVVGLAPRALAKTVAAPAPTPATPFAIKPDSRAVARRADSV